MTLSPGRRRAQHRDDRSLGRLRHRVAGRARAAAIPRLTHAPVRPGGSRTSTTTAALPPRCSRSWSKARPSRDVRRREASGTPRTPGPARPPRTLPWPRAQRRCARPRLTDPVRVEVACLDPAPHLRPRDLGGRDVLHQVVDRRRSDTAAATRRGSGLRPTRWCANRRRSPSAVRSRSRASCSAVTSTSSRVRPTWFGSGRRARRRRPRSPPARDPGARPTCRRTRRSPRALVLADLASASRRVHFRIATRRDERGHASDRVRPAPVAGRDEQLGVRPHERDGHRHLRAVGQAPGRAELLDRAEDVVPAPRVEAGRRGRAAPRGSRPSRTPRESSRSAPWPGSMPAAARARSSRQHEGVVPEASLEVALELRQVVVRAGTALEQRRARCGSTQRPKSNRLADTGSPSTSTWRSCRCQPRGRTTSVAVSSSRR